MSDKGIPKPGSHLWPVPEPDAAGEPDKRGAYRCSNGTGGFWHYACEPPEGTPSAVAREIQNVIRSIPEPWQTWAIAEFEDRFERATQGRLTFDDPVEVKELNMPPLLELRVQPDPEATAASDQYVLRLYFCEPESVPKLLLALKFGQKPSKGDPHGKQEMHIREAAGRYERGQRGGYLWGMAG